MTEERAKEEIYQAVRFLAPHVAEKLLEEIAKDMKKLVKRYNDDLEYTIFNA